jgi:hypothetical protein
MAAQEVERMDIDAEVVPLHDSDAREARVRAAEMAMVHDVKVGMIVGRWCA